MRPRSVLLLRPDPGLLALDRRLAAEYGRRLLPFTRRLAAERAAQPTLAAE
ncbi:MAG: hypothetical protein JO157_07355 [Acetobacteraceae bacterium]|nr:hypothetical protein [Acetobacteraceae bacterium]